MPGKTTFMIPVLVALLAPAVHAEQGFLENFGLSGTTGVVNTPVASVLPSGTIGFGFSLIDEQWAYNARGRTDNNHYFLTVGFLPRVELSVRISYFPKGKLFQDADREGTADRGGSGRILLLTEGESRPALAIGVDDVRGTRKFHSLYAVGGKTFNLPVDDLAARISVGYGSDALDAKLHVLDGGFGSAELFYSDFLSWGVDYDTEKWNTIFRLVAFRHLAARFVLLNFEAPAGGFAWTQSF